MKKLSLLGLTLICCVSCIEAQQKTVDRTKEKTAFQTSGAWRPQTDVRADVAIVYGAQDRPDMTFEQRLQSWRDRGYVTHFMTGIAWGGYNDYFDGSWDGKDHSSEGQVQQNGDTLWHHPGVPYIVPTRDFIEYMKQEHIKRVIDAGVDAIFLEEPEFFMRAGYSKAFKEAWAEYYGFPWRPQHESPENTYLSNKLKYHMYYKALEEVFTFAKEYGKSKGMNVRCYVPTHSLVNYTAWNIVSPEASLASMPCVDGYIAQVWTGTSRQPNYYNGILKSRVFENAYLEYNCMRSMTAPTGRKVFFLTDPIEDAPRDWNDYKVNYQATFTAKVLFPQVADFEVMPWPDRIYTGLYAILGTDKKEKISREYSTQMQVMVNSLNQMPVSENKVSGTHGIGVLMSNSLMFQGFPNHDGYEDPAISNFYGLVMPLIKRGIPADIVHIENVGYPETWKDLKVLAMTYSNMKPLDPEYHKHIAEWVKNGGVLVYSGADKDPYQSVMEWWNTKGKIYKAPSEHLFEMMGMQLDPEDGTYKYGKGTVYVLRKDPKEYVMTQGNDTHYFGVIKNAYEKSAKAGKIIEQNFLQLERGPFLISAVMDESVSDRPLELKGLYIDLFDPELPVLYHKTVKPGEQSYLYDLNKIEDKNTPQVLCGASRVEQEQYGKNKYSFMVKSPIETTNVSRVYLPKQPKSIVIKDSKGTEIAVAKGGWNPASKTQLLTFENDPDGIFVDITW